MKQITQRLRDGKISVIDVPHPAVSPEGVLIAIRASLMSAGTERIKVETGQKGLIQKARSRPDQVRAVVEKARQDGLRDTARAVRARLEQPSPLGYSAAGVVLEIGKRVRDLAPGDRVACGGGDYAVHAEIDHVPANLCVRLPTSVDFDVGAFATVGAIALHGVRQADVQLGERVAVIGLGLVGQLAGQLLRAAGCYVLGIDLSADLVGTAVANGSVDRAVRRAEMTATPSSGAAGYDAVIVTAATSSNEPVELAAELARDRGRVVIVGSVGMELPRPPYYEKELEVRLSRSYGPGRYDREYEERGLDYPIGYVRWTERRNMAAFLELAAAGRIAVESLITDRIPLEQAADAYERLLAASSSPLGVVFTYPTHDEATQTHAPGAVFTPPGDSTTLRHVAGVLGSGSFAQRTLIPELREAGFRLESVASASGRSAEAVRRQFGFARADTVEGTLADPGIGFVAIATTHASHSDLTARALLAGKAVFTEKPPCLTFDELCALRTAQAQSGQPLLVGFNRRHAPLARRLREHLRRDGEPFELLFRVNAGRLPSAHWLNDTDVGGGRLLGEGCHFIDFACWFAGMVPARVACFVRSEAGQRLAAGQSFSVIMNFADGSLATIIYASNGAPALAKEYVEAHSLGRSGVIDDFRTLSLAGRARPKRQSLRIRDKGHHAQFQQVRAILEGTTADLAPPPLDSMAVTLAALEAAETGRGVSTDEYMSRLPPAGS